MDAGIFSLAPLIAPVAGFASGIRFVQESERGIKLRWGRALRHRNGKVRIVNPGFVLVVPTIHRLRRAHIRTTTLTLDPQRVMLADHTVFHIAALIVYHIIDTPDAIYRALFEVDDLRYSVEKYCAAILRETLGHMTYRDLMDPDTAAHSVHTGIEARLTEWGVCVEVLKLTDCSPTSETARMILAGAEAEARADALIGAVKKLSGAGLPSSPTVAAALIGTPVAVGLGEGADTSPMSTTSNGQPTRVVNLNFGDNAEE